MAYPSPTSGVGIPCKISLSGTGVAKINPDASGYVGPLQYKVSLSLGGTNTVALTAAVLDVAGNTGNYSGSVTWSSDNAPIATVSAGTVTAVAKGQAVIEAAVPAFDTDGTLLVGRGKVYVQILVTVTA